jgi:hypothetical protein
MMHSRHQRARCEVGIRPTNFPCLTDFDPSLLLNEFSLRGGVLEWRPFMYTPLPRSAAMSLADRARIALRRELMGLLPPSAANAECGEFDRRDSDAKWKRPHPLSYLRRRASDR